jgi:hypothetical protein
MDLIIKMKENDIIEINWEWSEKQSLALQTMDNPTVHDVMYGGAKGACWIYWA